MPVPAHTRVTWSGTFGPVSAPFEEWSFNLNLTPGAYNTIEGLETAAAACSASWTTNLKPILPNVVVKTKTRVALLDGAGLVRRFDDGQYMQGDHLTPSGVSGDGETGTAFGPLPLQTACVVSLNTARAGASGKGRFFLPYLAAPLTTDGRYPAFIVEDARDAAAEFIRDINSALDGSVCVASSKGFLSPVTSIRVGGVPDTMRSRRGDMAEGYLAQAI